MSRLCLHAGAHQVTWQEVQSVNTPAPENRWYPIAHHELVNQTLEALDNTPAITVGKMQHSLSRDGARYFGIVDIRNGDTREDYGLTVGIRNTHDRSFAAGLALGTRVFVCDNLAFSAEVVLHRKHTVRILEDLPRLANAAIGKLIEQKDELHNRIEMWKSVLLTQSQVNDILIRALESKVITSTQIPTVLSEWRRPRFEDFAARTAWSLQNAFTEVIKHYRPEQITRRTIPLQGILNNVCQPQVAV